MLALVAVLTLGGCGFFGEPDAPAVTTHNRYPTKGDDKPHPGVARAHRHPVHGIDVSRYQGRIDWSSVAGAGTKFAFIKATEGGDHLDPRFMINWTEAKQAGVPRAAYHFVWWCRPAREQAAWFIQNVPVDPDALPPVIDVEWQNGANCTRRVSPEDAIAKIRIISGMLTARYGKTPIIYTDINFHRDVLEGVGLANPFWLRSTAAEPQERYRGRRWTMWQWTQTGRVPGIRGHVDRNVFYGTDREWTTFVASGCDPRDHGRLPGCGDGRRPRTEALVAYSPPPATVEPVRVATVPVTAPVTVAAAPRPVAAPPTVTAALPPPPRSAAPRPVLAAAAHGGSDDLAAFIDQLIPPGQESFAEYSDE